MRDVRMDASESPRPSRPRTGRAGWLSWFLFPVALSSCARVEMPPADAAARAYAKAVASRDVDAVWSMMTKSAREHISKKELKALLEENAREMQRRAESLGSQELRVHGSAALYLNDGSRASLAIEKGEFRVHSAAVLPRRPLTPEDAVAELREAIRTRDHSRVRALLTEAGRTKFDAIFLALDEAMDELENVIVDVRGDRAEVELPSGRRVILRREGEHWFVEEML